MRMDVEALSEITFRWFIIMFYDVIGPLFILWYVTIFKNYFCRLGASKKQAKQLMLVLMQ